MIIRHRYFGLCRKKNFFFVKRTDRFFNGIFFQKFQGGVVVVGVKTSGRGH